MVITHSCQNLASETKKAGIQILHTGPELKKRKPGFDKLGIHTTLKWKERSKYNTSPFWNTSLSTYSMHVISLFYQKSPQVQISQPVLELFRICFAGLILNFFENSWCCNFFTARTTNTDDRFLSSSMLQYAALKNLQSHYQLIQKSEMIK